MGGGGCGDVRLGDGAGGGLSEALSKCDLIITKVPISF